jgi:hypothetical protein
MLQVSWVQHDISVGLAQQLRGVLQWRSWMVIIISLRRRFRIAILPCCTIEQQLAVSALLGVNTVQERHDVLHNVLVVYNSLLETDDLLQQHRVMDAELVVTLLQGVQLRLCCHQLPADHIHLLRGHTELISIRLVGFAGRGRFPANVVERILVVHLEVGVLELPSLIVISSGKCRIFRVY